MLLEEIVLNIDSGNGLNSFLIVPDGQEYHLFLTLGGDKLTRHALVERPVSLGSILILNKGWLYEGDMLTREIQKKLAHYIINYKGEQPEISVKSHPAKRDLVAV